MSGLNNLNFRIGYNGLTAGDRMNNYKLKTLKKALLYSYQSETAVLQDGREFRCLINSDKLKADYDNKILSIPFKDICLNSKRDGKTSKNEEEIGINPGDIFKWKETDSYWIVYLRFLEERAYFRAEIYKCEAEVEINNHYYPIYVRGPVETTIQWSQKKGEVWNDLNYSLIIYISKNSETMDYFRRFRKVKIDGNNWEVKSVDPYSADGIIEVCLGEWYNNDIDDYYNIRKEIEEEAKNTAVNLYIDGKSVVSPFSTQQYIAKTSEKGVWEIDNQKKARIAKIIGNKAIIEVVSGKSGNFNLAYKMDNGSKLILPIEIESL